MEKQYNAGPALNGPEMQQEQQQQQGSPTTMDTLRGEAANGGKDLPPKIKKELAGFKTLLTKLMHSKQTRDNTMEMLKSGPPQISVPQAALALNQQAEDAMKSRGIKISNDVKLAGSVFLVTDLIELGNAGAEWEGPVDEQEAKLIYQDTLQDYIESGVRKGELDPMELQQQTEPLLTEDQRRVGAQFAEQGGVPMQPQQEQMLGNQRGMLMNRGGK